MSTLKELSSKLAQTTFDKKVLSSVQHIHPFVKHRIYIAETTGILPKNMYSSSGIIDESIIQLYTNGFNIDAESLAVKLELFKIVDRYITELFKKEAYHKNTISTDTILKGELAHLNEDFTVDADFDLILNTELNDISYKQNQNNNLYLYADKEMRIEKAFALKNFYTKKTPTNFRRFYSWLPLNISSIVDLYIFGNLSYSEISKIKNTDQKRIELIFAKVKKTFRSHLE